MELLYYLLTQMRDILIIILCILLYVTIMICDIEYKDYKERKEFPFSKDKGVFFWRKRWFSICSAHRMHEDYCSMCRAGHWVNVWGYHIEGLIYDWFPNLWSWWVNRKHKK